MRGSDKYKPAVPKTILLLLAGVFWLCIGAMLLFRAVSWLLAVSNVQRCVCGGAGLFLALTVYCFGFRKIVDKNLARILPEDEKRCLFAFMSWKSYLIIPVMIAMGMMMRHSSVPKQYVAIMYAGMGLVLIFSSFRYARVFLKELRI